jgi:hypothetical protein
MKELFLNLDVNFVPGNKYPIPILNFFTLHIRENDLSNASESMDLLLRQSNLSHIVVPLVVISFVMITFAKYQNNSIFSSLVKLLLTNKNFEQILKEDLKLSSSSSIALIVNYFFIISTCVFLGLHASNINISLSSSVIVALAIPFGVFLLQIVSLWIIGVTTKEVKVIVVPFLETIVIIEFMGFILFFLALVWVLNPQYSYYFIHTFGILLGLGFILRFFKSLFSVLRKGIAWYYIILYFCTLEILPLFIAYYYISLEFR